MLFLLACAPAAIDCPDGFALAADGLCYGEEATPPVASADDLLASLPACETPTGDGRIDLAAGCADGGCAGDSYAEMNAAYGEEGRIVWTFDDDPPDVWVTVGWSNGVSVIYPAVPTSGGAYAPDPDGSTSSALTIDGTYEGSTVDGLGPASELSCWIGRLGPPDLTYEREEHGYAPELATWASPAVTVGLPWGHDPRPPFTVYLSGRLSW